MAFLPNIQGIRVTGSLTGMTSITVTGNTNLASVTANTLTVTGNTRLAGLTATTISAGTYSNLPNTLYTGNGALSGNRLVDIGGNQLYFSGATNANALMINASGVGVGTVASGNKFQVLGSSLLNGNAKIYGFLNQGDVNSNNVENFGTSPHVQGSTNSSGQSGVRLKTSDVLNGVITLESALGDKTSFFSNEYVIYDDIDFDNVYGIRLFKIKSVVFNGTNTIITLNDYTVNLISEATISSPRQSSTFSDDTIAGDYSHAEGYGNYSDGSYSHVEGLNNISLGSYSHAEGSGTISNGSASHSEGFGTISFANYSHTEGSATTTYTLASHAEGLSASTGQYGYEVDSNISNGTIFIKSQYGDVSSEFNGVSGSGILIYDDTLFDNVYGLNAFRIDGVGWDGTNTIVILDNNLSSTLAAYVSPFGKSAPLYADKVIGFDFSHSEGVSNVAVGYGSHAQGSGTTSVGKFSFAAGIGTVADVDGMTVVGKYNTITNNSGNLFIIGNGDESVRGNLAVFSSSQVLFNQPLEITSNNALKITTLTNNSVDELLLSVDNGGVIRSYNVSNVGVGRFLSLSGGTVTGATRFNSGLTASTISGNGSGLTGVFNSVRINNTTQFSAGANTFINFSGVNISILSGTGNTLVFSASTSTSSVSSGAFLPLSGGTVTGGTIFQSGITANTISATSINRVDFMIFNTGSTSVTTVPGTVYFDNTQKALSYNTSINQGVTVNLGQQNYIRVYNVSGTQIERGKALEIFSGSSGLPAVVLAVNRQTSNSIIGLSAEVIPNNSEGIAITYGIIDNVQLTGSTLGGIIYASDTIPGDLDNAEKYLNFPLTARTNVIGFVVQTGVTDGKLFVNINNENNVLSLTDLQRNVLEGNTSSTGVFEFSGLSITAPSATTFNVAPVKAWVVDNTTDPVRPTVLYVEYSGGTAISATNVTTATETYILLTTASTLTQQTTFPTPQQRRENVYLGKFGHGTRQFLINAFPEPDYDMSPISQLRDMFVPIKLINSGVIPSPNGANLTFNTSTGVLYGLGINFVNNALNPNTLSVSGQSPTTFQYRTQTGGTASNRTTIDPLNYDLNGVITPVGGTKATNQRIYLLQNGQVRIQYGQREYNNIADAIAAVQSESFVTFPNFVDNGILIGVLTVLSTANVLNDTAKAQFFVVSKFGEVVGAAGGTSTTTLQQAYNNSSSPAEIITNSTLGALHIQNGAGADNVSTIFDAANFAGVTTAFMRADGLISGSSLAAPTISATTYYGLPSSSFSGGTVNGATNFTNGLTANTISAQTYENVNAVTGGTYNSGTGVITLSGTGNVNGTQITGFGTGGSFTGGTVSGATNFTGGLSSNTISATTYENVNAVTGGTYNSGTGIITLSGTGNVNGNIITGFGAGGGISWNSSNTTQSMTADNGYVTTAATPTITTFTLPTTIDFGKTLEIAGNSSGLWQLNQNSGQQIRFGNTATTLTTGILSATSQGDCIKILCVSADTSFIITSSIGNIFFN